jgi:hypothetical protein
LDQEIAGEILGAGLDPAWISGPFSFPNFAADTVKELYSAKPSREQKRLFISAFSWGDLQEEFPAWRERRKQEVRAKQQQEEAKAEKRRIAEARRNPPATCGHCGAALAPESRDCPSCGWMCNFDADSGAWEFHEPVDIKAMFEDVLHKRQPKGASP